jgi:hypothetical protein
MSFRIGQKVVCINDSDTHTESIKELSKGQVYTVARCWLFVPSRLLALAGEFTPYKGVSLHEVGPRVWPITGEDIPFDVARFRPLIERKKETDIGFALDILDKANGKVREPV